MSDTATPFDDWLTQTEIPAARLTPDVRVLLQAACRFQQQQGSDYYSRLLLCQFLLHAGSGLKVAQIGRLTGFSRATASRHQTLSAKQLFQSLQHRFAGRAHGKLLPRYAGPVAQFQCQHPDATHYDTLDFLQRTFGVRVSLQALHTFLNTYGLDRASQRAATTPASDAALAGGNADADDTTDAEPTANGPDPPRVLLATPLSPPPPGRPVPLPPPTCYCAHTQYAGAFLLLPQALDWLAVAQDCCADDYGTLPRGFLTSVFLPLLGVPRVFHLEQLQDPGFAWLTGGLTCPTRQAVGSWRRHLRWHEADAFCRRTAAWPWVQGQNAQVSFDEHSIPRWTHKFQIPKGYVTTRNKYMHCEKLYYAYETFYQRFLCVQATRGDVELRDVSVPLTRRVLHQGQPRTLHALFDAGAGKADADVRRLWDLVAVEPQLTVTVRACRYPHRVALWKRLPSGLFVAHEEAGPYVGAPPKEIRLAQTTTTLRGETAEQGVRTVVCRELVPGPKKDRWHPLFTTSAEDPYEVLQAFRQRQQHEQGYRVEVHDEFLDAVPCGYDKESPNPQRPRWQRGPLPLLGWLAALLYNALADLRLSLPEPWCRAQVGTLRRLLVNRPGQLYVTATAAIVYFDPFRGQELAVPLIDAVNEQQGRLPWLGNRLLVLSLMPADTRAGPSGSILDN